MLKSNWPYHDTLCPAHHAIQDGECCCHVKHIAQLEAENAALKTQVEELVAHIEYLVELVDEADGWSGNLGS